MRTINWADVGQRIVKIRGAISAREFAEKTGVHKNTLGNYERGETSVGGDFLFSLLQMGYSANWVLTGEGPMTLKELHAERFDVETLEQAVKVLEARLKAGNKSMTPEAKAQSVVSIYRLLAGEESDGKSRADIILELLTSNI